MIFDENILSRWQPFGPVERIQLIDARLQLHHAAQLVAAMGQYLLEPRPDDGHIAMTWSEKHRALVGEQIKGDVPIRGALRPEDLSVVLINRDDAVFEELHLNELTIGGSLTWLEEKLEDLGIDIGYLSLDRPYDLPEHPAGDGEPFRLHNTRSFTELANYWGNTALLLRRVVDHTPGASSVRCWPHHFDIATVITLKAAKEPEKARTITVGLSPGDDNSPMPYLYVTLWPYPDTSGVVLPMLPGGGEWFTGRWVGALLHARRLIELNSAEAQARRMAAFIDAAIRECRTLMKQCPVA